jgi:hypothetical protein
MQVGVKRTPHLKSSPHWREEKSLLPSGERMKVRGKEIQKQPSCIGRG